MVLGVAPRNQTSGLSSPWGRPEGQALPGLSSGTSGLPAGVAWTGGECSLCVSLPLRQGPLRHFRAIKSSVKSRSQKTSSVSAFYEDILCLSGIRGGRGQEKALPFILWARMLASGSAPGSPAGRVCEASLTAGAKPSAARGP